MPRQEEERNRLLVQIATMYYEEGLAQEEVARRTGTSRSNVSRLLSEARRRGIVEIRVRHSLPTSPWLECELKNKFHLRSARVLLSGTQNAAMTMRSVGMLAAEELRALMHHNIIVGIGWGTALYETVNAFWPVAVEGALVVQMIGSLSAAGLDNHYDGTELARVLAAAVNGQYHYLLAPNYVESGAAREALVNEPSIRETLNLAAKADLALVGLGVAIPEVNTLVRAGCVQKGELLDIARAGGVGDLCGYYFDIHGQVLSVPLHQRIVGIDLPTLSRIGCVIAVASAKIKACAILGALRGGYVDVLVTDDAAAQEVLRISGIDK